MNTLIGFRSVPASAPDPCTTMKPPQPMPLRVTGTILPAGARAEVSLHGPGGEIPAVLRVPGGASARD